MAQAPNLSGPAVLAVVDGGEPAAGAVPELEAAARSAGFTWHVTEPAGVDATLAALCPTDGELRSVAVVGVGHAGEPALMAAASEGRVGALVLVGAPLTASAVALVGDWPEIPIMAVAAPTERDGLRGAVDVHLASEHSASDLVVGDLDAAAMGIVVGWLQQRLTRGARVDEVKLTSSDGWELHGTRWLPERDHSVPGVVLLHTGRSDRAVFARLERLLADAGMAVLNFDWRGRGQSTNQGTYFDLSAEVRAAAWRDALAAVEHLAGQPEVDQERMGAVGVVHGAEYAVRAAVRDPRLRALVLLTGYRPADESESEHLTSGGVDVLYVTSTDHTITTDAMRQLYQASSKGLTRYVEYPGGAIGYQLFEVDHELEPAIVHWLTEALGS